jgi:signal transduction histidine kinase
MQGSRVRRAGDGPRPAPGAACALLCSAALAGCQPSEAASWAGAAASLAAIAALTFGLGWTLANWRNRQRWLDLKRQQAQEQRAQTELLDGWTLWTDPQHRLQRVHPPVGAPAPDWQRGPRPGALLWEHFESSVPGDVAGLRARLESQVPFQDLRVRLLADGSGWWLRAVPRHDDEGRFAGFSACARPTATLDSLAADQAGLLALLATLEGPALLAKALPAPAQGWQVQHINTAAQAWLQAEAGANPRLPDWSEVLTRLPAALATALVPGDTAPPAGGLQQGWLLRRFHTDSGTGLLLLRPTSTAEQSDQDAAAESASFSFTVSHDLRAPIRVVEGFTRILKEDYGPLMDRVGNDHLDRVLSAAARMNHMIDALLALAKLSQQPLQQQPVNLSQLAAYVVDELRRGQPDREADIHIEPDLLVQGDPTLLRLVLENLLGNAWKYSARTPRAQISFTSETHEGRRAFVVRDNGAGFDMRAADRLFGLFQRLHSATDFAGSGVGLASVRRIVRRHGGDIWAEGEPGRGAAFHFTLRE